MPIRPSSSASTFHLKAGFLTNDPKTFSFLVYSFIRKVPMYCKHMDLVESSQR